MKVKQYEQKYDGDKIELKPPFFSRLHKVSCCDCGLTHLFKYRLKGSTITMRVYRDNRATAQRRRHVEYSCKPKRKRK